MSVEVSLSWRSLRVWRHLRKGVNYGCWRLKPWGWWLHIWTPIWHEGRGPYVSIGLGPVAVGRGY